MPLLCLLIKEKAPLPMLSDKKILTVGANCFLLFLYGRRIINQKEPYFGFPLFWRGVGVRPLTFIDA
jgi:hypothetical protein